MMCPNCGYTKSFRKTGQAGESAMMCDFCSYEDSEAAFDPETPEYHEAREYFEDLHSKRQRERHPSYFDTSEKYTSAPNEFYPC
jgi:rubredoxin